MASAILEDDVDREDDEVRLVCTTGLDAGCVSTGAVEVWTTVKELSEVTVDGTVDGPVDEKENEVGVVTIPGKDTTIYQ